MIFYGAEDDAMALLQSRVAAEAEPPLDPPTIDLIFAQSKRADIYGGWPLKADGTPNTSWKGAWELDWAAAECWDAKAGECAECFGNESSFYEHCVKQAEYFRSRIISSSPSFGRSVGALSRRNGRGGLLV